MNKKYCDRCKQEIKIPVIFSDKSSSGTLELGTGGGLKFKHKTFDLCGSCSEELKLFISYKL